MIRDESLVQELPEDSATASARSPAKAILLFSDGTGNSSAKLFKTNVWRLYEATDLGPAPKGKRVQIAHYDNGVGTSAVRPLRWLGGIFGWGLKSNVLRLYTFLCRNYREEGQIRDKIYAFGFSRGAFTIRILVALIAKQGVLINQKDSDLAYYVHDAYREYCRDEFPRRWPTFLAKRVREAHEFLIRAKRRIKGPKKPYSEAERHPVEIEFVGVWDTVAAYGGPFAELSRGINDWVWPLSLPNYALSPCVRRARHALSLDDERDAFWPLLWDEIKESEMEAKGEIDRHRLLQVWFAGVHSDVGGGYPDESLSYASLVWMMDELKRAGIRFIPQFASRARSLANPLGPMHDSRAGFAAYYRYQPRKITAFLEPVGNVTRSLRDPAGYPLLKHVLVHESVLARIVSGLDNYAPAALPANFVPILSTGPYARSALSNEQLASLIRTNDERKCRFERQENQWDRVWCRRVIYFLTVIATLILVALPIVPFLHGLDDMCADDRCFAQQASRMVLFFLPSSFSGWLTPWARRPIGTLFMLIVILGLIWRGRTTERAFRDSIRKSWNDFRLGKLAGEPIPVASPLRSFREGDRYQGDLVFLKWKALPFVFGWLTLAAIVYAIVVVLSQTAYALVEPHEFFCHPADAQHPQPSFDLARPCTDLKVGVQSRHSYAVRIVPAGAWRDLNVDGDPEHGAVNETWLMVLGRPLKRVTHARWIQPVTEVRANQTGWVAPWQWLVGKDIELRRLHFKLQPDGTYLATDLCPRRTGRLFLIPNDGAPLLTRLLYANNSGSAKVQVSPLGKACNPRPDTPTP